jgi:hypothetical protein
VTRWYGALGIWLVALSAAACGSPEISAPRPDEPDPSDPGDAYVLLDAAASSAGWQIRVGGFCLSQSNVLPVAVPEQEWVLLQRWDEELYDVQYLSPSPGARLWVRGADANVEHVEGAAVDRVAVDALNDAELVELAEELEVQARVSEGGWELRAPDVWAALAAAGSELDGPVREVRPLAGDASLGAPRTRPETQSAQRETFWIDDGAP